MSAQTLGLPVGPATSPSPATSASPAASASAASRITGHRMDRIVARSIHPGIRSIARIPSLLSRIPGRAKADALHNP